MAFTITSIPPTILAFVWFSSVHFASFYLCFSVFFTVVECHIFKCTTSSPTYISIVDVSVDHFQNNYNPSCCSCICSVLSCSSFIIIFCLLFILSVLLLLFAVMFLSTLHPALHISALLMWVSTAFTTASTPPAFLALS